MLFGNGLACLAACASRWEEIVNFILNPDLGNAALEFVGGCLIFLHTIRAWKDEEIKGVSVWPFVFFWTWGIYNLWYYSHIGQPISGAVAFMPALANSAFLFSYWIFAGPINYDRRRDRARLWFLFRIRRLGFLAAAAVEENADMPNGFGYLWERHPGYAEGGFYEPKVPRPLIGETPSEAILPRSVLPQQQCNKCGCITPHDLDGHCMVCDTCNKRGN